MKWTKRWGYVMAQHPSRPGVYRLKSGGHYVRSLIRVPTTGERKPVERVLHDVSSTTQAQRILDELVADEKAALRGETRRKQPWTDFAVSLLEERIRRRHIESKATMELWADVIAMVDPVWGHLDAPKVTHVQINAWLNKTVAQWMETGRTTTRKTRSGKTFEVTRVWSPARVNGVLRIIATISNAVKKSYGLTKSAMDGVDLFREGRAHTIEEPNSLPPDGETTARYLTEAGKRYPQHYAMILLGFVTGLRGSSLRPLRRKGPNADVDWERGLLHVRRSHSRGQSIMDFTKSKRDVTLALPPEVMAVLRAHVARIEAEPGPMAKSDLLFPAPSGALLNRAILLRPFQILAKLAGLDIRFTPHGMRRTFRDQASAANVPKEVIKAIANWTTDDMLDRYGTTRHAEGRAAISRIAAAITPREGKSHE